MYIRRCVFIVFCLFATTAMAGKIGSKDTISKINHMVAPTVEFVLAFDKSDKNIKKTTQSITKHLSQLLKERFTESELLQIEETYEKVGGENIPKMAQVMMQQITTVLNNPCQKLEEVKVNISPAYDELLEKKFAEQLLETKMRTYYMNDCVKPKAGDTADVKGTKADGFVKQAKKHFKKVISDNFTEEQYSTYYHFENSELGKKFDHALQESMMMAMKGKSKLK